MKLLLAAVLAVFASPAIAQDFYEARLRAGEANLTAGRAAGAVEDLRIASFGLLGQPALLCEALANLAVAQNMAGRQKDAAATLGRYAEAARGAPACREAHLDPGRRSEFEALARKLLPQPTAENLFAPPKSPSPAAVPVPAPSPTVTPGLSRAAPAPSVIQTSPPPTTARPPSVSQSQVPPTPAPSVELDRQPQLKVTTRPDYPEGARRAGIGGVVLLRVLVSASGEPQRVEIARGVQPDLDQAAVTAVRQWLFEPGVKAGRATAAWMTVAVPFEAPRR